VDANFGPRPVEFAYQPAGSTDWVPVTAEPIANTGRFDWRLPDELTKPVRIRLTATDLAGHRVDSEPQAVELRAVEELPSASPTPPTMYSTLLGGSEAVVEAASPGSDRARQRASGLFAEAIACRERGEHREAIGRLREVVRLHPQMTDAFVELGDVLYRVGEVDRSIEAYELALRQQPSLRAALRGEAKAHAHKKDYSSAARMLRVALRYNPQDAELWLNLGDVAVYQGDELLAREAYTRATQADPAAARVVAEAQKRLDLMHGVSRTYRSTEP
jgi:thioredoxin-like negative regulator of GroEL